MSASARYHTIQGNATVDTPQVVLEVHRSDEAEGEPDAEVVEQRNRVQVTQALERAIAQGDQGQYDEARDLLAQQCSHLRRCKETKINAGLIDEVEQAQNRLQSASAWRNGGKAWVEDSRQMFSKQRCTTMSRNITSQAAYMPSKAASSWAKSSGW